MLDGAHEREGREEGETRQGVEVHEVMRPSRGQDVSNREGRDEARGFTGKDLKVFCAAVCLGGRGRVRRDSMESKSEMESEATREEGRPEKVAASGTEAGSASGPGLNVARVHVLQQLPSRQKSPQKFGNAMGRVLKFTCCPHCASEGEMDCNVFVFRLQLPCCNLEDYSGCNDRKGRVFGGWGEREQGEGRGKEKHTQEAEGCSRRGLRDEHGSRNNSEPLLTAPA